MTSGEASAGAAALEQAADLFGCLLFLGSAQLVAMMEADAAEESKSTAADRRVQEEAQTREEEEEVEEKSEAEKKEWEEAQELLAYADDLERALPQVKRPRKLAQQRIAGVKDLLRRV